MLRNVHKFLRLSNYDFQELSETHDYYSDTKTFGENSQNSMVAYFCHYLSDNYVDLSDLYVDSSVIYVDLSDHYVDFSDNDVDLSDLYVDLSDTMSTSQIIVLLSVWH